MIQAAGMVFTVFTVYVQKAAMQADTASYAESNYAGWKTNFKLCRFNYFFMQKNKSLVGAPQGAAKKQKHDISSPAMNYDNLQCK